MIGVARVGRRRVHGGILVAAPHPFRASRHVPERAHELPAFAAIIGAEQAGRDGADPQAAGLLWPPRLDRKHLIERRLVRRVRRKGWNSDLRPGTAAVARAMQLWAQMPMLVRGIH